MTQERAISHTVGSLYNFSETAGCYIVSSFSKKSSSNINCRFTKGNVFTVDASPNDESSLACVLNSVRNLIFIEKNRKPELFEDEMITRIRGTHSSLIPTIFTEMRTQSIKPNGDRPLIEHENIIRKWSPRIETKELGSKLSLPLLGKIGSLCRCRIEHASDSADFLIKADREQDIEKGISKLKRLSEMAVDEMSFPQIHSFYVLEGEMSISLRLLAFKDLHDKRPVTTLIRKGSAFNSLRDLCVLALVKGSDIVRVDSKPAASSQECRLWNEHVQSCDQAHGLIAAKTLTGPETPIDKWVSEVTDNDVQVDAFRPGSNIETQHPIGLGIAPREPSSPTKKVGKSITKRARTARGKPDTFNTTFDESRDGHGSKEAMAQENVASFSEPQTTGSTSTGKEAECHCQPPSIEPPYMPPLAMPSSSFSMTPSRASKQPVPNSSTWGVVFRGSKSGHLVDMSIPNEGCTKDEAMVVIDHLQDAAKDQARNLKYTMQQRKAPRQAFVGGDTALVRSIEESVNHLLILALHRTGRIGFTVDIGRLLIKQQCNSDFKNRSFNTSEFSAVLPKFSKGRPTSFEPMFTDMLTARSSEAEGIVNLVLSQGRRLFQQQPASRKVAYMFSCKTKGGDQIIIESDGKGDFSIQGTEILMGTLDWHFPKRAWDARLRLTSERFLATDHQRQVRGIIDSLKISVSEDGQSLELYTQTIDDDLSIESITLHRETLHPVTLYPDLVLHMTEHQDLQVQRPSGSGNIYTGSIQGSKTMIKANKLWWGAKLSSISADTILKENATLELGETATWVPSSIISKGVVRDLFAATKETVTRIDHVGFFNRGQGSSNSKTTEKPSENTQDLSAKPSRVDPGYW